MIRIITVAREYGSGGAAVGRRLADNLGWQFVDRCLIEKIAALGRVPVSVAEEYDERAQSWMERLLAGFTPPVPEMYASPASPEKFDAKVMHALTEHVIQTAAETGNCVIVGRGSQCVLSDRTDALHVFVYAPTEQRIRRLQKRFPKEKNLAGLMEQIDQDRASYVRQNYRCQWDDRHLYDLCVNTRLGIDAAAAVVQQAAHLTPIVKQG